MTTARDHLSKADTVTIAAIEARVPTLVEARTLVERFQAVLRQKLIADLDPWIDAASAGLMADRFYGRRSLHGVAPERLSHWPDGEFLTYCR
jgi:hypothetical protein